MTHLEDKDKLLLTAAVRRGEAFLVLGAGASATSIASDGKPILQGAALAALFAEMAGLQYDKEPLPKVLTAIMGSRISIAQRDKVLREKYTHCAPSNELQHLLNFSWKRLYSWNIDDTIENCRRSAQIRKFFNGITDSVTPASNPSFLQVVHLHGEAEKPEHGFIFSEREYNEAINSDSHHWYRQLASDYAEFVPIFVGSQLNEPILNLELERARPSSDSGLGTAFLVSPDKFTEIEKAAYQARNIAIFHGTLADFVKYLGSELGTGSITPTDVTRDRDAFGKALAERTTLTSQDIQTAHTIKLIAKGNGKIDVKKIPESEISTVARDFLEGSPPNWPMVLSEIPVWLRQTNALRERLMNSFASNDRAFFVYGQSGSGKSTAIMQVLLNFANQEKGPAVYEISGEVISLRDTLNLLMRLHPDEKVIAYADAAFIFGDSLEEDILSIPSNKVFLVADARPREWKQHIKLRLQSTKFGSFQFQRFERADFEPLADKIVEYVPAPKFHKLGRAGRVAQFENSRSQLLIALKEATHATKFKTVIKNEFEGIPNGDSRFAFLLIGLSTIARTGISRGMIKEVFDYSSRATSLLTALADLEGMISTRSDDRIVARHELYFRHIVENVAPLDEISTAIKELLRTFTKFEVPIVKTARRQDALFFKFIINHNFLLEIFRRRGVKEMGIAVYQEFEVQFQRDGHYWLQYGQYLSAIGERRRALPILEKSIQAYPDNIFAVHALADLQLRVAGESVTFDAETAELVGEAVETLEDLHAQGEVLSDHYPMVTLAERHTAILVKHGQLREAKQNAKRYFEELSRLSKGTESGPIETARTRLLYFLTQGSFPKEEHAKRIPASNRGRPRSRKNHQRKPHRN